MMVAVNGQMPRMKEAEMVTDNDGQCKQSYVQDGDRWWWLVISDGQLLRSVNLVLNSGYYWLIAIINMRMGQYQPTKSHR